MKQIILQRLSRGLTAKRSYRLAAGLTAKRSYRLAAGLTAKQSYRLAAGLTALAIVALYATSCNLTRTITTKSEYWQKADTSVVIQTKTIESYDGTRK